MQSPRIHPDSPSGASDLAEPSRAVHGSTPSLRTMRNDLLTTNGGVAHHANLRGPCASARRADEPVAATSVRHSVARSTRAAVTTTQAAQPLVRPQVPVRASDRGSAHPARSRVPFRRVPRAERWRLRDRSPPRASCRAEPRRVAFCAPRRRPLPIARATRGSALRCIRPPRRRARASQPLACSTSFDSWLTPRCRGRRFVSVCDIDSRKETRIDRVAVTGCTSVFATVTTSELVHVFGHHVRKQTRFGGDIAWQEHRALMVARIAIERLAVGQLQLRYECVPHERRDGLARRRRGEVVGAVTPVASHAETP